MDKHHYYMYICMYIYDIYIICIYIHLKNGYFQYDIEKYINISLLFRGFVKLK